MAKLLYINIRNISMLMKLMVGWLIFYTRSQKLTCPNLCICRINPHINFIFQSVHCDKQGLQSIPLELPDTDLLDLGANAIQRLEANQFVALPNMTTLFLQRNRISTVHRHAFDNLNNLKTLDMSENLLNEKCFSEGQFYRILNPLISLRLDKNSIRNLSANMFPKRCTTLSLKYNNIEYVEEGAFAGLDIVNLYLSHNPMKELPLTALKTLSHLLIDLNLANISLTDISKLPFFNMPKLVSLNMDGNPFSKIPHGAFQGLPKLQSLYLNDCNLGNISQLDLGQLSNLITLHLSGNKVEQLDQDSFFNCEKLVTLNLTNSKKLTKIKADSFRHLINMRYIILSNGGISVIERGAFMGPSNLAILELHNNNLTTLREDTVSWNKTYITLYGNPWNCNCSLSWLAKMLNQTQFQTQNIKCEQPPTFAQIDVCDVPWKQTCSHDTHSSSNGNGSGTVTVTVLVLMGTISIIALVTMIFVVYRKQLARKFGRPTYTTQYDVTEDIEVDLSRPDTDPMM